MLIINPIGLKNMESLTLQRPYALLLVGYGEGMLCVDGEMAELKKGRVFFLKGEHPFVLQGEEMTGHLLEFREVMLHAFLLQFVSHRGKGLYNLEQLLPYADLGLDSVMFLLDMIAQLNQEMDEGTSSFIFMHYFFVLLRHVNKQVELKEVMAPGKARMLFELVTLMEEHFKKHRSTAFYAALLGMKGRELNDFSHEVFGKRFFNVIMERLLTEADLLLADPSVLIKEIAYQLGFDSPGHFTTYYIRYKAMTPKQFREGYLGR